MSEPNPKCPVCGVEMHVSTIGWFHCDNDSCWLRGCELTRAHLARVTIAPEPQAEVPKVEAPKLKPCPVCGSGTPSPRSRSWSAASGLRTCRT